MQKYLNHEKKLEFIIANNSKKFFKYKGFHIFKIIANWQEIAQEYSEICQPINLQKQQNSNILFLEIENEALIFELEYNKDHLITLINQYFGKEYVSKLKFKIAEERNLTPIKNITKKPPLSDLTANIKAELEEINDDDLKAKLTHLAYYIK